MSMNTFGPVYSFVNLYVPSLWGFKFHCCPRSLVAFARYGCVTLVPNTRTSNRRFSPVNIVVRMYFVEDWKTMCQNWPVHGAVPSSVSPPWLFALTTSRAVSGPIA